MGELIPLFPLGTPLFPGIVLPLQIFEPRYRRLMRDLLARPEGGDGRFFGVVAIRQGWEVEQVAPAEALYDIGCTARVQAVRPQPDGGFRIVTVGGERFRLLDVVVGEDPPYLQAAVEWLADEEAAEEAAGDSEGLLTPGVPGASGTCDEGLDEVVASVARGSLDLLARGVRDLFTHYVAEVADLGAGDSREDGRGGREPTVDAETAVLLGAVADDPAALSYLVASAALLTTEDRQALLAESATRRRLAAESRLLRRELTLLQTLGAVPVPLQQFAAPMTVN
jgi:Lon protease-like protein